MVMVSQHRWLHQGCNETQLGRAPMAMEVLSPVHTADTKTLYAYSFHCPGCDEDHDVGLSWQFNNDMVKPTFYPSILVRGGHFIENGGCWCKFNEEHPDDPTTFQCKRCHSYVENGNIRFLDDCSHSLAGQTVPLKPWSTTE